VPVFPDDFALVDENMATKFLNKIVRFRCLFRRTYYNGYALDNLCTGKVK